jgi:cytidylate kinase
MSIVAISETAGSLGNEIGRRLAERLGYRFADREIIAKASERFGENVTDLRHAAEEKPTLWERLTDTQHRYKLFVEAIILEMRGGYVCWQDSAAQSSYVPSRTRCQSRQCSSRSGRPVEQQQNWRRGTSPRLSRPRGAPRRGRNGHGDRALCDVVVSFGAPDGRGASSAERCGSRGSRPRRTRSPRSTWHRGGAKAAPGPRR